MRILILLLLAIAVVPGAMRAQSPAPPAPPRITGPHASAIWALTDRADADTEPSRSGGHWVEGAVTGGIIGGILGAVTVISLCEVDESGNPCGVVQVVEGTLVVGAIGAITGGLIGALFPKH
jgi:hypothetical protein